MVNESKLFSCFNKSVVFRAFDVAFITWRAITLRSWSDWAH